MRNCLALVLAFVACVDAAEAAGKNPYIPAKKTFPSSDSAGGQFRCAFLKGVKVYVVKQQKGYLPAAQVVKVLKGQNSRAQPSDRKKLKRALVKLQDEVRARDPLCRGNSSNPPPVPSLNPGTPPTNLDKLSRVVTADDVLTLVDKAGFGLGADEQRLIAIGTENGIDALVDAFMASRDEAPELLARVNDELDGQPGRVTTQTPTGQRQALLDLWIHTKNPYAERLSMALLGIWTVGGEVIEDETFRSANWDYILRLRNYAHGSTNLPNLAVEITRDPLMLLYLNNSDNKKGFINENYARELMELFTLGPVNLDNQPNYTETNLDGSGDIPTAAKLLTGWTVKKDYNQNKLISQFVTSRNDDTPRAMFLGKEWQFQARTDEELVRGIFAYHPEVKNFYAKEILKLYLTPDPPRQLIEAFGKNIADSNYDLRTAMRSLFVSAAFYDQHYRNTIPADPYTFAARAARTLRLEGAVNVAEIERRTADMGFTPNLPPSVFWYPQSAWSSSSVLLEKANLLSGLLGDSTAQKKVGWQPALVLPVGKATLDEVIEFARLKTHIGSLSDAQKQTLLSFMSTQLQYDGTYLQYQYDNTKPEHQRVKGLGIYFLMLMAPRFQLL